MGSLFCATLMYANLCFSQNNLKVQKKKTNFLFTENLWFFCTQATTWSKAYLPPMEHQRAIFILPALGSYFSPSGIRDNLRSGAPLDKRQSESFVSFLTVNTIVDVGQELEWDRHHMHRSWMMPGLLMYYLLMPYKLTVAAKLSEVCT